MVFEQKWNEVLTALSDSAMAEGEARAMLELARGATSLGQWERAAEAAERALAVASQRGEGKSRITAEALLESVRGRTVARAERPEPTEPVEEAEVEAAPEAGDRLAEAFVGILKTYTVAA